MGLKMAGAMTGLGQGISNLGQIWNQAQDRATQEKERTRQAQMQALQLALQQESFKQQQEQQDWSRAKDLVGTMPAGTSLDPEVRKRIEAAGFGPFVKPDVSFGPTEPGGVPNIPVHEGLMRPGEGAPTLQTPGAFDTGKGTSIPTEDAATRRATLNQNASMERTMARIQSQQAIASQKATLEAQAQAIRERIAGLTIDARKRGDDMQLQAALASIAQRYAALDQQARQFDVTTEFNQGPAFDQRQFGLDTQRYRAENPTIGAVGISADALLGMINTPEGGAPPAVAPAAKPPRKVTPSTATNQKRRRKNAAGDTVEYDPATPDKGWYVVTPAPAKPSKK